MKWHETLDPILKQRLELLIKETHNHEEAMKNSENQMIAQLWIALSNISIQLNEVTLKLSYLERAMQELNKSNMKTTSKQEEKQIKYALKKVMVGTKKK